MRKNSGVDHEGKITLPAGWEGGGGVWGDGRRERERERVRVTLLVVVHVARAAVLWCPAECAFLREGISAESHKTCSPQVTAFPRRVTRSILLRPQWPTTS